MDNVVSTLLRVRVRTDWHLSFRAIDQRRVRNSFSSRRRQITSRDRYVIKRVNRPDWSAVMHEVLFHGRYGDVITARSSLTAMVQYISRLIIVHSCARAWLIVRSQIRRFEKNFSSSRSRIQLRAYLATVLKPFKKYIYIYNRFFIYSIYNRFFIKLFIKRLSRKKRERSAWRTRWNTNRYFAFSRNELPGNKLGGIHKLAKVSGDGLSLCESLESRMRTIFRRLHALHTSVRGKVYDLPIWPLESPGSPGNTW